VESWGLVTVLFDCIAAALLLLFIFDRAGEAMLGFLELHAKNVLRHARERRAFSESQYRI
jgi:hypothetical protein